MSPRTLRHTKGMHLVQAGVSLELIRDFLGHQDAAATQLYARANLEMQPKALEKVTDTSAFPDVRSWKQDRALLDWLQAL